MKMEIMRSKIVSIAALALIALGIIAVANATGATNTVLVPSSKTMRVTVESSGGSPNEMILTIWLDDQVWKKMTLPEGEYTLKTEDGQLLFKIGPAGPSQEAQEEFDEAVKIAESDERVQGIIDGKDYKFTGMSVSHGPEGNIAKLRLVVGDRSYDITIDLDDGVVTSIEPTSGNLVEERHGG